MTDKQRIEELITQLADFRTRAKARRELGQTGEAAFPALLALLSDENASFSENVRWCAIVLLSKGKCEEAVPLLIEIVRNELGLRGAAVRALRAITGRGEDIVGDADAWEKLLSGKESEPLEVSDEAGEGDEQEETITDDDELTAEIALFREALSETATEFSWKEDGYLYTRIPLSTGRKQQMLVTFDSVDPEGNTVATVYTECGPATEHAKIMLPGRNMTTKHGKFGIEEREGEEERVVMSAEFSMSGLSADFLRDAVISMASDADSLEFEITHKDAI